MVDPEVRDSRQQHLDDRTAQIVRNEEVRVDQMQLADECLQHLTLVLEDRDIGVFPVLDFLLQIKRQWLLVEFSEQGEGLESFLTRRSILINLVLHDAGNESDLLRVMLRSCHLHGEGQGDQRWARPVHVINCADTVLGVSDENLLLAPCFSELLGLLRIFNGQPAWALDLLLEDKELKHRLLRAKDGFKGVACQVGWESWHRGWVLDFEDLVLSMLEGRLERILASDTFALEHGDILKSALTDLLQLRIHIGQKLVLLFLSESAAGLVFHLGHGIHRSFHAFNFQRARYVGLQLWLPDFTEQEELAIGKLLFMCVDPEEG